VAKYLGFVIILLSFSAHSLDLEKYKEQIRGHVKSMFGEEISNKLLGEKKVSLELPNIPKVEVDATSTKVYSDKNRAIEKQGSSFKSLSNKEKRKYQVAFIQELYEVTRNSEPKQDDVIKYLNVLEQGGSREGVYRAITLDDVYSSLESYDETPEKALSDFTVKYGEKYLGRVFDGSSIRKLNLWSIKRIITEKTLEVMDVLANNPKDLYTWYAVFSAELATKYPKVWQTKIRSTQDPRVHLNWASQAPFQHIKSETIIKLHKLMNFLNQSNL
tara:strand:- start:246426 stop:247244 length:819 start_codon:yes stop_codon:yes gene_type:complete